MFMGVTTEFVVTGPESARSVTKGLGAVKQRWGSGQVPFLLAEQRKGWSLMIFCARATRGLGKMGGEQPDHPSCSQNAHDETVLVRCAQGRTVWLFPSRSNWENRKALAWANGTSRRASGWAGEKAARSGRSVSPHP